MASDPGPLRDLGKRLDQLQAKRTARTQPPPNAWAVVGRFAADLVAGLFVGGGLGWGIDWLFGRFGIHTRPVFMIGFLLLGAAAGIRNVIHAAQKLNADHLAHEE